MLFTVDVMIKYVWEEFEKSRKEKNKVIEPYDYIEYIDTK